MTGEKNILHLTEADYVNYQLFHASQSAQVRKSRQKTRFLAAGVLLATGIALFFMKASLTMVLSYLAAALLVAIFYPWYQKLLYERHYRKFVRENYGNLIGRETELTLAGDDLLLKDADSETKIQFSRIEKIAEVPETFYIKLNTASSVIIPKSQLKDTVAMRKLLQNIACGQQVPYEHLPDWKWK